MEGNKESCKSLKGSGMTLLSCLTCFCNNSLPGFQKEADSLLSVTKLSIISDSQNMSKARDILLKLLEETNIFPTSWELSERYLFVVVSTPSTPSPHHPSSAGSSHEGEQVGEPEDAQIHGSIWGDPGRCCTWSLAVRFPWKCQCCSTMNSTPLHKFCATGCSCILSTRWEKMSSNALLSLRAAVEGGPRAGMCLEHPAVTTIPAVWQDRLIALDAADEFFKMASTMYPKRPGGDRADEGPRALQSVPAVVP